jgi:hypothetical protein
MGEHTMPFDGTLLHGSPIFGLPEAERGLPPEAKRSRTRERYAKAKLPAKLVPLPGMSPRRTIKALESLVVLDLLEKLLDGGNNWCQHSYHDGRGNRCLMGGLRYIRSVRGTGDHAGVYLSKAIVRCGLGTGKIIDFNDSRSSYEEVRAVIVVARELAKSVVDNCAGQMELVLPRVAEIPSGSSAV